MKNDIKKAIIDYLTSEIDIIVSPTSGNELALLDLEDSFRLLFNLLEHEISYTDLDRIEESFAKNILSIIDGNLKDFPDAIETLASNYEAFLKKIAYLKYKGTPIWEGTSTSSGLQKTMLYDLCKGEIDGENKTAIPEPLVDYTGVKREILDFVRINLRNSVHISKTYKRSDLVPFANLVISCYLFTVYDNKQFLKRFFYPEYKYLDKIVSNKELHGLEQVYVELIGQDSNKKIDMMGKQIKDEMYLLSEIEKFTRNDAELMEGDDDEGYIDNISNIIADNKNLQLIGSPGSGKSTTLKRILYTNAQEILQGNESLKLPFYIEASEIRSSTKTIKSILDAKLDEQLITTLLEKGKAQVLIDGINEIIPELKVHAVNEIKTLISKYPNSSFIITDRKYNYTKNIGISIFELRDLEDGQIKQFIEKNTQSKSNHLWQNISDNEEMLALASNPLMLKMYLSVVSLGEIPANRGQLYDLFIMTMFSREEQKKKQFDKDIKKRILSEVAYKMRSAGLVSADKSSFINLIGDTIKNHNFYISELLFHKEVLDNNIVKENENNEISFLHETYQEYFSALHLKHCFLRYNSIDIEVSNAIWLEPLLLCNDLFNKASEQLDFFEFLFIGEKRVNDAKILDDFRPDDFNEDIQIACKVAYRHKILNDVVYKTAEMYLGNYLALSKRYFINHGELPISISSLFNAVSSLSSNAMLKKIFTDTFWVEQWLYSEVDEESYWSRMLGEKLHYKDYYHKERFQELSNTIIDNISDLASLLNVITVAKEENVWFKSVSDNLRAFKKILLQSVSLKQLLEYYENIDFDIDVFINILKQESSFINKYDFDEHKESTNIKIIEILLKFHHAKPETRTLVIDELENNEYDPKFYLKIANLFFENNHFDSFLQLSEYIYAMDLSILDKITPILQRVRYEVLPASLRNLFIENPGKTMVEYVKHQSTVGSMYFTIPISYLKVFENIIKDKHPIFINNSHKVIPTKIEAVLHISEYVLTAIPKSKELVKECTEGGTIEYKIENTTHQLHYTSYKPNTKGDKINFSINPDGFTQPKIKGKDKIVVNKEDKMTFVGFTKIHNEIEEYEITTGIVEQEIPIKGFINIDMLLINFSKPNSYHPDTLKIDYVIEKLNEKLTNSEIDSTHIKEFIKKVGLSYLFYDKVDNVSFGVVVSIFRNLVRVHQIKSKSFRVISCTQNELRRLETNTVVIIENNGRLTPFDHRKWNYNIGFSESVIIELFSDRREGFIRNDFNKSPDDSDFYFHFDSCNFAPKIGDTVRFIPSVNPFKNYKDLPVAILIERIDEFQKPACEIVEIIREEESNYIRGFAIDTLSDEELFFSITEAATYYVKDMGDDMLDVDQCFEYTVFKEADGQFKKHIKLLRRIDE